jgi:RHS repeat-associated protein
MMRAKRASRQRVEKPRARAKGAKDGEREAERYAGAFARVRLVRAWIAAVAAVASMVSPYVALLERLLKWWATLHQRRAPRVAAVLAASCVLLVPRSVHAVPGGGGAGGMPGTVSLSHDGGGTANVYTNGAGSTTFTLQNISAGTVSINLVATACSGSLAPGTCSPSPSSTTLGIGQSTTITVSFTGGASAGSGTLTLAAKNTNNVTEASSSVTVTVNTAPQGPLVSLSPHRGDMRDVSQCIADCFETTLDFTTPAYMSLDVPRSVTLLYRSGRARPFGRLSLDVRDTSSTVTSFRLQIADPNGGLQVFSNGTTSLYFTRDTAAGQQPTRLVAEFDASTIPTSAKLYTASVTSFAGATPTVTGSVGVRIIVVNGQTSPFGAGVDVVGLQRVFSADQTGGVLVTDGSGSASFFSGSCTPSTVCTFTSPSGDFSTLKTGSGTYKRTYPDGTTITFNSTGFHVSTADRFGTTTQISYGTTTTGVTVPGHIVGPTSDSTVFWYRDPGSLYGTWKEGTLGNIHTPAGDAPIGIDTNNDAREWVELGGGTYRWRMKYLANHLIDTSYDKANSAWKHAYRYGATRAYVEAPGVVLDGSSSTVRPRSHMRDAWAQLLDSAAAGKGTGTANALAAPIEVRASVTDARGHSTYFTTNRFGAATKVEAPLIPAAVAEFDTLTGQLVRSVSPTGHVVRLTWNGDKLTIRNDSTLGKVDSIWYASQYSLPIKIKGVDGEQWFWYDSLKTGWPMWKSGPTASGPFTLYYADAFGRDTVIEDPFGHRTSFGYATTGLRNRMSVTAPNQQTTTVGRNAVGMVQSSMAPNGAAWTSALDILNRPAWVAGQYGDTTKYQYDALNALAILKDAKGQADTLKRNALGWVYKHVYASGSADSTAYDSTGNVVYTRSREGREVRYVYDALGRLVKRTGVATGIVDSLWYDANGKWVAALSRVGTDTLSRDTLYTDEHNRKAKATTNRPTIGGWRVESNFTSTDPGRSSVYLYKRVNNADSTVTYTYFNYSDAQKRLTSIWGPNDTTNFHYDGESLLDSISLRAGLTATFTQTSSHQLATRGYAGASWVHDALRRWYRSDSLGRVTEGGGPDSLFQAFAYDSAGRLRSWTKKALRTGVSCTNTDGYGYTCTGATPWTLSAAVTPTYDKVGNPTDLSAVTAAGNRLTTFNGVTMTYDADGFMRTRVTSTTTDTLTWDEFGRLVSFKRVAQGQAAATTTFAYDGFGRRIRKATSATTVHYLWDGDQILAELDSSGVVRKTYTYYPGIDQPRSVTTGGQTYFFSAEPDGTVNGVIRKSDRTVVAQYAYTPWGELESAAQAFDSVSNLRWKGLPYDSETGLYAVRARYYDPTIRRFISEDPIGLEGGINSYAFAEGDPVNGSDPTGLDPQGNGYTGCWDLVVITQGSNEWGRYWAPVECSPGGRYGPSLSEPHWGPAWNGPPGGATSQTTRGGIDYGRLASTARKKLLACSDRVVGVALAATGTASFYKAMRLSYGFIQSGRATQALMAVKRSGYQTRQLAWRFHHEQYAAKLAGGSALLGAAGSPSVAFHDAYFFNAEDAAKLVGGFIPFVNVLISVGELGECLVKK